MASPSYYQSYVTGLTNGQFTIPGAPYSWTVTAQSGAAYVNGFALVAGNQLRGGGYASQMAGNTKIVVGCTGGNTLISWDL